MMTTPMVEGRAKWICPWDIIIEKCFNGKCNDTTFIDGQLGDINFPVNMTKETNAGRIFPTTGNQSV